MATIRRAGVLAWLALTVPAQAQVPAPPAPDASNQLSELVVVAHPQGPALWRVQRGDSTLIILGSVTPLQQQQHWDQRQIQAALSGARLLLTAPKPALGPMAVLGALTSNVWKVRQSRPLEPGLPRDLRARFVAARSHAYEPESRYAHWRPAVAGFLLMSDYRRSYGFSEGKPDTTVEKMAKEMGVRAQPVGAYRVGLLMKLAGRLDERQNLACLADTLDQMEYEGAHVQDLNDDWAKGDVRAVAGRYRVSALQRCLALAPGSQEMIDQEMDKAVDRLWAELQKPGKVVAVIDLAWLLPRDGVLDRLKAKGASVGVPAAQAAAR